MDKLLWMRLDEDEAAGRYELVVQFESGGVLTRIPFGSGMGEVQNALRFLAELINDRMWAADELKKMRGDDETGVRDVVQS